MIKLNKLIIIESLQSSDKTTLRRALNFFKHKLNLKDVKIRINLDANLPLNRNGDTTFKQSKEGTASDFRIKINSKKDMDIHDKIKTIAHELLHIHQLLSGRLNIRNKTWDGKKIGTSNYYLEPWESDARINSEKLYSAFIEHIHGSI